MEDFKILEVGTKVKYDDKIAYIMGDDRDNCPDGYHESLNYYIKFALENETYEEIAKRVENEDWYDDMILWYEAKLV